MSSIVPQLIPIEINNEKRRKEILTNIIKMLTNRLLLNKDNLEANIEKILKIQSDDMLYEIKLDYPTVYYPDSPDTKIFYVKILNQKISGVPKVSNIGEFLNTHKNNPKLVVVTSITSKAKDMISYEYPYTQVFLEKVLMMDLIGHISVPEHTLLSEEDGKKVLEEYNTKKRELPKIFASDPVAYYYNAPVGRIFKITRPSETSGKAPFYRLVIKSANTAK